MKSLTRVFNHPILQCISTGSYCRGVGREFSCTCEFDCLSVHAMKEKRLELSTPKSLELQSMAGPMCALTIRSKDRLELGLKDS